MRLLSDYPAQSVMPCGFNLDQYPLLRKLVRLRRRFQNLDAANRSEGLGTAPVMKRQVAKSPFCGMFKPSMVLLASLIRG